MRISVHTSKGVQVNAWREGGLFHVTRADSHHEPQVCMGVDLFEIIAELCELDLERSEDAREALELASTVQTQLA